MRLNKKNSKEQINQEIKQLQGEVRNDLVKMKHISESLIGIEQRNKFDEQIKKVESMDMSIK